MELKQGRPQEKRIAKEERVYDLLEKLHIDYQRIDHEKADTMEICLEIEKSLQATICKNLFLVNSNKSQYYLLMLKEHKKFKTKNISKQINSSRLSSLAILFSCGLPCFNSICYSSFKSI